MNESKGVWWAKYQDVSGNEHSFTLRQEDSQSDDDFIVRVTTFEGKLKAKGFSSKFAKVAADTSSRPLPKLPDGAVKSEIKSFDVESIKLASGGDHPRWIVKGGNFKKFGVTCWPECLQEAGVLEHLDPMKDNKPQGNWIAWYQEKLGDDGKMKPDKIVRLEKK